MALTQISTKGIKDSEVKTVDIADSNVTTAKIADSNVTTAKIADSNVTTAKIADLNVTTAKIAADAVTNAKIADDQIDSEHYVDASIDTQHIGDLQVTTAKIANDAITTAKIGASQVTADEIAANAVTESKIQNDAVTIAKMAGLTRGSIIYGDASGNPAALALGSNNNYLKSDGTDLIWGPADEEGAPITQEEVEDIVGAMVSGNTETNISVTYDDTNGKLDFVSTDTNTQLTTEEVQDIVGAMVSGNTETNIAVTYDDTNGKLDFVSTDTNTPPLTTEEVQDIVGGMVSGNTETNIAVTYDDTNGKLDFVSTDTDTPPLTTEQVQDIVGAMVSGNTETGIGVTYEDSDGTLDFIIGTDDIVTSMIDGDAVTGAKIADDAVGAEHIEVLDAALQFGDSVKAQFGTGNDLEIYHDGSNTYLKNTTGDFRIDASGPLMLRSDDVRIYNAAGNEFIFHGKADGSTDLYYDNVQKINTNASGVDIGTSSNACHLMLFDGGQARFGTGQDLQIYHDGSHSFIKDAGTGTLRIESSEVGILSADGSETMAQFVQNDAASLRYDNSTKLITTADGVKVDGDLGLGVSPDNFGSYRTIHIKGPSSEGAAIRLQDNGDTIDSDDFIVYKNASAAYLRVNGTDPLIAYMNGGEKFRITSAGKVGLNISNPSHQLHVAGGSAVIDTTNNGYGGLKITDSTGGDYSARYYAGRNQTGTAHVFYTGGRTQGTSPWADETGTEIARISGNGIAFNGDTAAANALDDYEEGDWDARIGGQTNNSTYYQGGNAQYTKIGRLVYVHGYFAGIDIDNSAAGQVMIFNLPFTPTVRSYGGQCTASVHVSNVDFDPGRRQTWTIGSTGIIGYQSADNGAHSDWDVSDFNNSSTFIWFSATYITTT